MRPLIGRLFDSTEALPGAPQVVLLSAPLWREKFGADSAIVGRHVSLDRVQRLVIGVLPASFTHGRLERYWVPLRAVPATIVPPTEGEVFGYSVVARLRVGASMQTAERRRLPPCACCAHRCTR